MLHSALAIYYILNRNFGKHTWASMDIDTLIPAIDRYFSKHELEIVKSLHAICEIHEKMKNCKFVCLNSQIFVTTPQSSNHRRITKSAFIHLAGDFFGRNYSEENPMSPVEICKTIMVLDEITKSNDEKTLVSYMTDAIEYITKCFDRYGEYFNIKLLSGDFTLCGLDTQRAVYEFGKELDQDKFLYY